MVAVAANRLVASYMASLRGNFHSSYIKRDIDMNIRDILEGLLAAGEYEMAEHVCTSTEQGLSCHSYMTLFLLRRLKCYHPGFFYRTIDMYGVLLY